MKEENEYIDTLVNSTMNSYDVDMSMLNDDWNDLKPLLLKKKKRRFFILFFLISPFVVYGAYSLVSNEWFINNSKSTPTNPNITLVHEEVGGKQSTENLEIIKHIGIEEEKTVVENSLNKPIKAISITLPPATNQNENKEPLVSSGKNIINVEGNNNRKRANKSKVVINNNTPENQLLSNKEGIQFPLLANQPAKGDDVDVSVLFVRRPMILIDEVNFINSELQYPPVDSMLINKKNKIYKSSIGLMCANYLVSYSKAEIDSGYHSVSGFNFGANYSVRIKNRLEFIVAANYSKTGFEKTTKTTKLVPLPTQPPTSIGSLNPGPELYTIENVVVEEEYNANYLNLNMGVNWEFVQRNKIDVFLNCSPEINFLLKENGIKGYSSKISSSLNLGVGMHYRLSNRIKLVLQPSLNYMYLGFDTKGINSAKPYSIGGNTGIKFIF